MNKAARVQPRRLASASARAMRRLPSPLPRRLSGRKNRSTKSRPNDVRPGQPADHLACVRVRRQDGERPKIPIRDPIVVIASQAVGDEGPSAVVGCVGDRKAGLGFGCIHDFSSAFSHLLKLSLTRFMANGGIWSYWITSC